MARPRNWARRPVSVTISRSEYDGQYHGTITVGVKPNGQPDRRRRRGATYEECADKIRELEDQISAGAVAKPGKRPTVQSWLTTWLTDIAPVQPAYRRSEPLRPLTIEGYWSKCRTWIFPHLGALRLDALDTDDLDRLYSAMYAAGLGGSTVRGVHSVLRRGLRVAMQRGKVERNVAALLDSPGTASGRAKKALSPEQARAVLAVIEERDDRLRWKVGLAIGPRQGEALAIRWQFVDLDEGTVDLSWQIQRRPWRHGCIDPKGCGRHKAGCEGGPRHNRYHRAGCPKVKVCPPSCDGHEAQCPKRRAGGIVFCRPKTYQRPDDAHIVALPAGLVAELRTWRRTQAALRLRAGTRWEDYDLVFSQASGRPLEPRKDHARWAGILKAAGLAQAGTHVMRHTAATMLLEMGEHLEVVAEVLGHRDTRTSRGYAQVSVGLTRRAADRMDGFLSGSATDLATVRDRKRAGEAR